MIYRLPIKVKSGDTDLNGVAGASMTLRYMQEAANMQLHDHGPSNEALWEVGRAFILSRVSMCLYRPLYAYDELVAETWACESRGASFERCARLSRGGEIAAECVTIWALINVADRSLLRVSDVEFGFSTEEPLSLDAPQRVRLPRGFEPPLVGERPIVYSDLDRNRHMNNTNYPDMLCDFLPGGMLGRRVVRMNLHFMNEAAPGDTVKIYGGEYDSSYYFRTVGRTGVGVEAELVLDALT